MTAQIRQYDFEDTGVETATQPTAADPVDDSDLATKGYIDDNYVPATRGSFTIPNNTSTSLTGILYDHTVYKGVKIDFSLERYTDSSNVQQSGTLWLRYDTKDSIWHATNVLYGEDEAGVIFGLSNTTTGQVAVSADNLAGSNYGSDLKLVITTFPA